MQKYTKALLALAGVILPFLESVGVPLPAFLTLGWLQGIILAVTPVLVYYFPNTDKAGNNISVRSPAFVGVLAILLTCLMLSGCAGTRAAYQAAEGLEETAKVVGEHYYALVREANDLDDKGMLSASALAHTQDIVRKTSPAVLALAQAAVKYKAVKSATNELELERALSDAAIAVSRLIDAIRRRGTSLIIEPIERDLERILAHLPAAA